jgi:anti-anti-sigma factor
MLKEELVMAPNRLSVLTEQIGSSTTIRPVGKIDVISAWTLGDSLRRIIARPQAASITLDLSRVSFVDARGLRALVSATRLARRYGLQVRIKCGNAVRRAVESSGAGLPCS